MAIEFSSNFGMPRSYVPEVKHSDEAISIALKHALSKACMAMYKPTIIYIDITVVDLTIDIDPRLSSGPKSSCIACLCRSIDELDTVRDRMMRMENTTITEGKKALYMGIYDGTDDEPHYTVKELSDCEHDTLKYNEIQDMGHIVANALRVFEGS